MASSNSTLSYLSHLLISVLFLSNSFNHTLGNATSEDRRGSYGGRRGLLSIKETPAGSNSTFECAPSGPCVFCLYSEKNDKGYRCSETGYRIPLKCVEMNDKAKKSSSIKSKNSRSVLESPQNKVIKDVSLDGVECLTTIDRRNLLDDLATSEGQQTYITYRSCIPAANEERLSVLGFEAIMLCLLSLSGSFVHFRKKQSGAMSSNGAMRFPTSSRF